MNRSTSLKALLVVALLAAPAFAYVKGTPQIQGVTNGTPVPVSDSVSDSTSTGVLSAACSDANIFVCGAGSTVSIAMAGQFGASFIITGSNVVAGTLKADCGYTDGTTPLWVPTTIDGTALSAGVKAPSFPVNTSNNAGSIVGCTGAAFVRVRMVSLTSGTANVLMRAAFVSDPSVLFTNPFSSVTQPPLVAQIGGWNGSTLEPVSVKSSIPFPSDNALIVNQSPVASPVCTSKIGFSQTASARIVLGALNKRVFVCGIVLISATAQSVSLVEGSGTTCIAGIIGVIGGSTASLSLAANGGFTNTSDRPWLMSNAGNDLCLLQSGTGNVSGVVTYVVQ